MKLENALILTVIYFAIDQVENKIHMVVKKEDCIHKNRVAAEELQKQQMLFDQQQRDIRVENLRRCSTF